MNAFLFSIQSGLLGQQLKRKLGLRSKLPRAPKLEKQISFPWESLDHHVCFVCSPQNPHGLKMQFFETPDADIACKASPQNFMQGYPGVYHGGVSAAVLDEIGAHAVIHKHKKIAMTLKLDTEWLKPLSSDDNEAIAQSRILSFYGKLYRIESYLFRKDGKVAAKAVGTFYTPTLEEFQKITQKKDLPIGLQEWFTK